jgi:diguanylate cyclase (GGDEF)-like protein
MSKQPIKLHERRRILVIDDNEAIHVDFRKTLCQESSSTTRLAAAASMLFDRPSAGPATPLTFDVESALQGQEGEQKVAQALREGQPYAVAFVDMRMPPGWDGVETIQHLWKVDPDLQVVICTAFADYSWNQIIDKLGATDRLLILKKPFDPMEVCQLATALCEKWKLKQKASIKQDELEGLVHERTAELRRLALTDQLTGLPNRASLTKLFDKLMARCASDSCFKFAVLFIDFDRFKIINDSLGHRAGDEMLVEIANRLRALVGQDNAEDCSDGRSIAFRLGGDEFVVLQIGVKGEAEPTALAEKLLDGLGSAFNLEGNEVHSTASMGIALSNAEYQWGGDILRDADSAMYRAKATGKARYVWFTRDMHEQAISNLNLESDLRRALRNSEFHLVYQPIVSLTDARLIGFEALLRWRHPERGPIPPIDFISMSEEIGLIVPIGQWVLQEATRQLQDWRRRLPAAADLTISINCSRRQLVDLRFPTIVREALSHCQLPPNALHLELTESVVMDQPSTSLDILQQLRSIGVHLHMDDFGTGYSSLSYLHKLPLNVLKIDRSFVLNVSERRDYAAVIHAIIQLAHNLGMKVVAEGVELAEHVAMLCALDCDYAQGYLFAKPLPPPDAEEFILARRNPVVVQAA